jgi:hypothetical protein
MQQVGSCADEGVKLRHKNLVEIGPAKGAAKRRLSPSRAHSLHLDPVEKFEHVRHQRGRENVVSRKSCALNVKVVR